MPKVKASIQVEEGISVFTYATIKEGWYVRKWNKHERKYRIKKIDGAETQEQALANFYKALVSFERTPQRELKRKATTTETPLTELIQDFLLNEEKRVSAGIKDEASHYRRKQSMRRLADYLEYKNITYATQINNLTFEEYVLFRQAKMKGTIKSELRDIAVFFRSYLQPRGYVSNEMVMGRNFFPKVVITDDELDANPAITEEDYEVINKYIRKDWMKTAENINGVFFRHLFHTFIHLLKNSGCRPSELLALRMRDIEITNPKRWSESKQEWVDDYKLRIHIRKSKTGKKRDIPCRSNSGDNLRRFLKYRQRFLAVHYPGVIPDDNSLVFGKPQELLQKTHSYNHFGGTWRKSIIQPLRHQLKGNRFSERAYTLYSLRSTFIETCITAGLDVYLVARLCGNSVNIIQRVYDKHDVLKRSTEIQQIPYGKQKPPEVEVLNLLEL